MCVCVCERECVRKYMSVNICTHVRNNNLCVCHSHASRCGVCSHAFFRYGAQCLMFGRMGCVPPKIAHVLGVTHACEIKHAVSHRMVRMHATILTHANLAL